MKGRNNMKFLANILKKKKRKDLNVILLSNSNAIKIVKF